MGVPLIVALMGERAAGPVIVTILADLFVTSSICLALAQSHGAGNLRHAAGKALQGALSNPLPWSIAAGAVVSALRLSLPGPLDDMIRMLGNAASPVALSPSARSYGARSRPPRARRRWPTMRRWWR